MLSMKGRVFNPGNKKKKKGNRATAQVHEEVATKGTSCKNLALSFTRTYSNFSAEDQVADKQCAKKGRRLHQGVLVLKHRELEPEKHHQEHLIQALLQMEDPGHKTCFQLPILSASNSLSNPDIVLKCHVLLIASAIP